MMAKPQGVAAGAGAGTAGVHSPTCPGTMQLRFGPVQGPSQQTRSTQNIGAAHWAFIVHPPPIGIGVAVGVIVEVTVGELLGVVVGVEVAVPVCVAVEVAVGVSVAVGVAVGVSVGVHVGVSDGVKDGGGMQLPVGVVSQVPS